MTKSIALKLDHKYMHINAYIWLKKVDRNSSPISYKLDFDSLYILTLQAQISELRINSPTYA